MQKKFDVIVVGSGAGGATAARELARRGKDLLIIEAGDDKFPPPLSIETSKEGVDIYEVFGSGGATVLCNGNGVRALEQDLAKLGIRLEDEYRELEAELPVKSTSKSLLSENGGLKLLELLDEPVVRMELMPKFIDPEKCKGCTLCSLGCKHGAKWDVRVFLNDAIAHGAKIVYNTKVERVIIEQGKAAGVEAVGPSGIVKYFAEKTIIAAGGLKTPVILQNSGLDKAGKKLHIDMCEIWMGVTPEIDVSKEPPMQLVHTGLAQTKRISLSTVYFHNLDKIHYYCGDKAKLFQGVNWLGILVKIGDTNLGRVFPDGSVSKSVTANDREKFVQGGARARRILQKAGASEDRIVKLNRIYGGHNGATAAIGDVVNTDLHTEVENLFVGDGSVLPIAPGLPPVLTIMALARRLGRNL